MFCTRVLEVMLGTRVLCNTVVVVLNDLSVQCVVSSFVKLSIKSVANSRHAQ